MKFINLTPHTIDIHHSTGEITHVPPSGEVARCAEERMVVRTIGTISVEKAVYGEVTGLPDSEEGTIYIMSMRAAQGVSGRNDVVLPGEAIRDKDGKIVGCRGLSVI